MAGQKKEVESVVELDQFKYTLGTYKQPLEEIKDSLDLVNKEQRVQELERKMEEPDFWDNPEKSQESMKTLKSLKDDIAIYHHLTELFEEIELLIEMGYEENDPAVLPDIQANMDEFITEYENIRMKTLLSGEYDNNNAIVTLHAGAGGTESCDWCGMLYRMYSRWVDKKGFSMEVLDYLDGDEAGVKSVTFQVNGENAFGYLKSEKGRTSSGSYFPVQCGRKAADFLRILRCHAGYRGGSGRGDPGRRYPCRYLPFQRSRRAAYQQNFFCHPYHPFTDRYCGTVSE